MPEEKIIAANSGEDAPEAAMEKQAAAGAGPLETFPAEEKEARIESGREQAEGKYREILSKVSPPNAASAHTDDDVALDAKSIGAIVDEESKVQKLLDLAGTKGVAYAVKVARSFQDYYALDRMHDELADKLYDGLLARGLIRKD